MIRPAERFTVNIPQPEAMAESSRPLGWSLSLPTMLIAATIVGAGVGGIIPSGQPSFQALEPMLQTAQGTDVDLAAIEPAAGPAVSVGGAAEQDPMLIARAPDGAFYAMAALDRVPVTMRLDPDRPGSLLVPRDAARLVPGGVAQPTVRVAQLALHGHVAGPVEMVVGAADAPTSVLGADLLADFAVVEVDRDHVRLVAR